MSRERMRGLVRSRLRLRALVAVVSVILVALAAFDLAAVTALRGYLMNRNDASLHVAADHDAAILNSVSPTILREFMNYPPGVAAASSAVQALGEMTGAASQFIQGQYTVLYWPNGTRGAALAFNTSVISTTPSWTFDYTIPQELLTLAADGGAETSLSADGTTELRVVAAKAPGGLVTVSASLDDNVTNTVNRMWLILILGSAGAVLLIGLVVFWLLRRGLRPIETMATEADRITVGDLTDRVTEADPRSEVGRLGTALNGMLTRIETSVHEREAGQELMSRFFADASHELRTPLASLRANAELYQQGALPERDQVDEVMRRITLEAQRMSGLVDDMLRLARLDQHPDRRHDPVDLSALVAACVDRIRIAAPQRDWHTEIAPEVVIVGDEELLRRAVDNLLANVLAHTPEDTAATVALRDGAETVEIEVSDTGPGVPEDRLPHIFDRFYRADTPSPRPGSGLGLAIVDEITTVHNGSVTAGPNSPQGLRVRLTLPVSEPAFTRNSDDSPAVI